MSAQSDSRGADGTLDPLAGALDADSQNWTRPPRLWTRTGPVDGHDQKPRPNDVVLTL